MIGSHLSSSSFENCFQKGKLTQLATAVKKQEIDSTLRLQEDCSRLTYEIRSLSLPPRSLPFDIPTEYDTLPRLKGWSLIECTIRKNDGSYFLSKNGESLEEVTLTLTVDGYHAPLTAGNFVDLVQRKFYDGLNIQQAGQIVQTGDPLSELTDGFIDPTTLQKRKIPLELYYNSDTEPTYVSTRDNVIRTTELMALPFRAVGALG